MDQELKPVYSKASTTLQLQVLKGSKYVQVVPGQEYMWVKKDLCEGRKVLFSGTPCYVAGLKRYLKLNGINTDLLFTCDLICHGVVSAGMFEEYIDILETHFSKRILNYIFRDKSVGGSESYYMKGKRMCSTNWGKLYYSDLALRESCYQCQFSSSKRVGDLTIGDYIGIERIEPNFDDKKGVSLLLINNQKGEALFNDVKGELVLLETGLNDCMQNNLHTPTAKPQEYEDFWKCYMANGFEYAAKRYCGFDLTKDWEVLEKKQYIRRLGYKIEHKYKRLIRKKT